MLPPNRGQSCLNVEQLPGNRIGYLVRRLSTFHCFREEDVNQFLTPVFNPILITPFLAEFRYSHSFVTPAVVARVVAHPDIIRTRNSLLTMVGAVCLARRGSRSCGRVSAWRGSVSDHTMTFLRVQGKKM